MRRAAALAGSFAVALACTSDLDLSLSGKQCAADKRCVRGYECEEGTNLCVPLGTLRSMGGDTTGEGTGGDHGIGSSGGAGAFEGSGGAASDSGAALVSNGGMLGANGGTSDAGDVPESGAGGSDIADAASADACMPVSVFRDQDGDGYGDTEEGSFRCPAPGWVTEPGDCRDDQPDVFPGQLEFFGEPYPDPAKPEDVSFDYDCVGGEQADPLNAPSTPAPANCADILNCTGSGFLPASPPRSGIGIEPRCGSILLRTCVQPGGILTCGARDDELAENRAFRCK